MPYMLCLHGPIVSYVKLQAARAPEMPGTFSPSLRVCEPGMHHGTCVTHVPWCMPGSLSSGFLSSRWRENVPGIPGACATHKCTYLVRGPCWQYWEAMVTGRVGFQNDGFSFAAEKYVMNISRHRKWTSTVSEFIGIYSHQVWTSDVSCLWSRSSVYQWISARQQ